MKIKSSLLALLVIYSIHAGSASAALVLSGVYDGFNSTPKGVEVFVTSTGAYTGWTVDLEFNANTTFTVGYVFDATVYDEGDFILLTSTPTDAALTSLTGPTVIVSDTSFNMNGDDRIRITDGITVIDQYGVSGLDGTGTPWEYTDTYAIRNTASTASGAFVLSDWTVAPIDTLDAGNGPLATALVTYSPVPEPAAALLGAFGLIGLLRRRRLN